ncbi:MAG: hypothetical protein MJZ36_02175 [Bacteroidaceae bacterium]|nr:hypothetical protein [Bacteroidaceae bacterium]
MRKYTLILLLMLVAYLPCHAQQLDVEGQRVLSYIQKAMKFSRYYPQEKVYLHLDNTGYFKGETIWFKAYVKRCDTDSRTDLSHVLYVELLTAGGDVVESRKLAIENGEAHGDIKLDRIFVTGFYEIRAYTRYMTNWGTDACFSRVIPIFKTPKTEGDYSSPTIDKLSFRKKLNNERLTEDVTDRGSIVDVIPNGIQNVAYKRSARINVRFYPEGGQLVKGLPAKVAITISDGEGHPMPAQLKAINADGTLMDSLETDSMGWGMLNLMEVNEGIKLLTTYGHGKTERLSFPEYKPEGCSMHVDMQEDELVLASVRCSPSVIGKKMGYVMIHDGSIIRCDTMTASQQFSFTFNKKRLPEGVSQLTLFDAEGHVMAERRFFIFPTSLRDSITIRSTQDMVSPCGPVGLQLQAAPNSTISLSAVDSHGLVNGQYGNMRTWMLLCSDLRGYISHPEYYLQSNDLEHRRRTDLLMMIHGWSRYDWNLMVGNSMFDKFEPIEDHLYLFGHLHNRHEKRGTDDATLVVRMRSLTDGIIDGSTSTDADGSYSFVIPDIYGEWELDIQTRKKGKSTPYMVGIDRHFSPRPRHLSSLESEVIPVTDKWLHKWDVKEDTMPLNMTLRDHVLDNVTVKAKGRVWDRTLWQDETEARSFSLLYYDCDKDADRITDYAEQMPSVAEWLISKNHNFAGEAVPTEILLMKKNTMGLGAPDTVRAIYEWFSPASREYSEYESLPPHPWKKFYADGLVYNNRPIVWIIDNQYATITGFRLRSQAMPIQLMYTDNNSNSMDLPTSLDELKCIYVSDNSKSIESHLLCPEIEQQNPIVLYCYTHRNFQPSVKGLRRTHFQGFNKPSTFKMEDYSILPPMADFRRTIYWNPNIRTDADGKAKVEFYNNSTCNEMYISAEGMSDDGRVLINE